MRSKVEISHKTIVFTIALLIILWILVQVRQIIFLFFVSFILMAALTPAVEYLEKLRIPRAIAIVCMYAVLLIVFAFTGSTLIPPLLSESFRLIENLPVYLHEILPFVTIDPQSFTQYLTPFGKNVIQVTIGFFSNVFAIMTIFILSFYLVLERKYWEIQLQKFIGIEATKRCIPILTEIELRLGAWVRSQLLLAAIIGCSTFIGLTLLSVPFALPLAILAGLFEIIPIIGPIIAAVPAILVSLTIAPYVAMSTLIFYILLQQVEANAIVPVVMRRSIGISPLMTILALMIGGKLAGITGALLSIPIVVIAETIRSKQFSLQGENETPKANA